MKSKVELSRRNKEVESYFLFEKEQFPNEIKELHKYAKQEKFNGKEESTFSFNDGKRKVIVFGLGKQKEFELDLVRKGVATAFNYANAKKAKSLGIRLPKVKNTKDCIVVIGEAITLASFEFDKFKSKKKKSEKEEEKKTVDEICLHENKTKELQKALEEGIIKGEAQNYSREIQETPPNVATPLGIAKRARELAKKNKLSIKLFGKKELEKKGMNAILAVNKGSGQPPVMVILEYNKGKRNLPLYIVVGKGITFDSGGISLKPSSGMEDMKYDKTGACNTIAVIKAVSELKLPIRLMAVAPLTENMPGTGAQRPSDIIKAYNGKTIEVINTDAEGRLILADALTYASEQKPKAIIDMATLTGAVTVALGHHAIGMFSNDDKLAKIVEESGKYTHERVWRLPLWKEYSEMIKSDFADIKNLGSERGNAGTITAAVFLKEFIGKSKWIHLDIAGVDHNKGHVYLGKGASGTGTRLVIETLKRLSKK